METHIVYKRVKLDAAYRFRFDYLKIPLDTECKTNIDDFGNDRKNILREILYIDDIHLHLKFLGLTPTKWPIFCDRVGTLCWFDARDDNTLRSIKPIGYALKENHTYIIECKELEFTPGIEGNIVLQCTYANFWDIGKK